MRAETNRVLAWALILANLALAMNIELPKHPRAPAKADPTSVVLGTASGGALDPLATRPPLTGPKPAFAGGPDLTINVVNSYGTPLSIFYGSNENSPTPLGNPGPGILASTTKVLFPSDWAGRITLGLNDDPKGSLIEASFVHPDYVPDVDISYVDAFTVPISCSCQGVAVTGCNGKTRSTLLSLGEHC